MMGKRKPKKLSNVYKLFSGNLIVTRFKRRRACAVYRWSGKDYDLFSDRGHDDYLAHLQAILEHLQYPGQIKQIPIPITDSLRETERTPETLQNFHQDRAQCVERFIRQNAYRHEKYLIVGLSPEPLDPVKDLWGYVMEGIKHPIRTINEIAADQPFQIASSEWDRFRKAENRVFHLLSDLFDIERVDESEVDWLIERHTCRGYDPVRKRHRNQLLNRYGRIKASPSEVLPGNTDGRLKVKAEKGLVKFEKHLGDAIKEGWFSQIAVQRYPESGGFPGGTELFLFAQILPYPCEINVTFYPEPAAYNMSELEDNAKKAKGQLKHNVQTDHSEQGWSPAKTKQESWELHQRLEKKYKEHTDLRPIFRTQVTLTVWGNTPEEVSYIRDQVVSKLRQQDYSVQIPLNYQAHLYHNTLPGVLQPVGYTWNCKTTSEWLSSLMPTAQIRLGSPFGTGSFLGHYGTTPVFMDTEEGPRDLNRSPSIVILGPTGRGKSVLANSICIGAVERGAKILLTDRKNERWGWIFQLPHLADHINIITLSSESDAGRLDPLSTIRVDPLDREEKEKAIEIATRIMQFLCECSANDYQGLALYEAIRSAANSDRPCLKAVIEFFKRYLDDPEEKISGVYREDAEKEIRLLYAKLIHHSNHPKTRLLFGDGTEEPLDLSYRINLLQVEGVEVPEPEHADFRQVMAVHMAQAELCRRFVSKEDEHNLTVFEETWSNKLKSVGLNEARSIIKELVKTGRSKNNGVILVTQNVQDLAMDADDEGAQQIGSNMGARFVFRLDNEKEAKRCCEILGIDSTPENIELLTKSDHMPNHVFLMRDLRDRVGQVYYPLNQVDPELYQAFDTSTRAQQERLQKYGHYRHLPLSEQRKIAKQLAGIEETERVVS